jgi:cystathionine gamma-lyase/cystathionine beta-lyase
MKGFLTKCVHAGQQSDKSNGALAIPITMSSTFLAGSQAGFSYGRLDNPVKKAAEDVVSSLEKCKYTLAVSSGTAAAMLVSHLLKPGDHLIVGKDIYCGIIKSFMNVHYMDNEVTYVDLNDEAALKAAFKKNTKVNNKQISSYRCYGMSLLQIQQ